MHGMVGRWCVAGLLLLAIHPGSLVIGTQLDQPPKILGGGFAASAGRSRQVRAAWAVEVHGTQEGVGGTRAGDLLSDYSAHQSPGFALRSLRGGAEMAAGDTRFMMRQIEEAERMTSEVHPCAKAGFCGG